MHKNKIAVRVALRRSNGDLKSHKICYFERLGFMCIHCSMLRPAEACVMAASISTAHKPNRAWYLEAMVCESSCMCTADSRGRGAVCQAADCSCITENLFVQATPAISGLERLGVFYWK